MSDGASLGAIPGLAFRSIETPADYAAMVAVRVGSAQHDQVDPHSSRESIPDEHDLRASFSVATPDLILVTHQNMVIGYAHVCWRWTEVTGVRVYLHLGYLLPAWRGQGIGSAMLHWTQQRIRSIASVEQADQCAMLATNVSSTEQAADALIRGAGYRAVRRLSDMAATIDRPILPAPLPAGLELRPVEAVHYRTIYQTVKDAFRTIPVSPVDSEADFEEFLADNVTTRSYDPALWQIAWANGVVVGVVISRIRNEVGQIAEVAVHPAWRRRGIARILLQHAQQAFIQRDIMQVRLYTDAADGQGARSLYESLGFREVKQHIFYRKPLWKE